MEWSSEIKLKATWKIHALLPDLKVVLDKIELEADIIACYFDKKRRAVNYFYIKRGHIDNKQELHDRFEKGEEYKHLIKNYINGLRKLEIHDEKLADYVSTFIDKYDKAQDNETRLEILTKFNMDLWASCEWYEVGLIFSNLKELKNSCSKIELLEYRRVSKNKDKREVEIYYREGRSIRSKSFGEFTKEYPKEEIYNMYWVWHSLVGFPLEITEESPHVNEPAFLLPIFDIYVGNRGYGGFNGFYHFFYKKPEGKTKEEKKQRKKAIKETKPHLAVLSKEIYLSNLFRIENEEIKKKPSYNFVDYFLQMIIYVQDWENIWVTTKSIEQSEKNEKNKFTEEDINRYWTRKSPDEKKGKFTYEWIDSSNGDKKVKELNDAVPKNVFEFHIKEVAFLLEKEDTEYDEKILEQYLICEYPKASVIPNDASDLKEYKKSLTQRFLRVFDIAIREWQEDKYENSINVVSGCIEQMSCNLYPAVEGIQQELKDLISDKDNEKDYQATIEGSHIFFQYLGNRLRAFERLRKEESGEIIAPGENKTPESITEIIADFNKQKFLRKYIIQATKSKAVKKVEIIPHINEEYKVLREPLYMFLENYTRNVAKHQTVISPKITCHIEISCIENSEYRMCIWEDSEKKPEVEEFYKDWENLNDYHQKVQNNPPFGPKIKKLRGISAMEWLLKVLVSSRDTRLEVSPVVVSGNGEIRYKVKKDKCGCYYTNKAGGKIRLYHGHNQRFSMEYSLYIQNKPN